MKKWIQIMGAIVVFLLMSYEAASATLLEVEMAHRQLDEHYSQLIDQLLSHFDSPQQRTVTVAEDVLMIEVTESFTTNGLVIFNDKPTDFEVDVEVDLPDNAYFDYVSETYVVVQGGRLTGLTIEAGQLAVIYLSPADLAPGSGNGIWTAVILGAVFIFGMSMIYRTRKAERDKKSIWGN